MRLTRSRVVTTFLVLLGGAIAASTTAAQPQQAQQQPPPPLQPATSAIVRPPELQRDVDFWIHIYTVVTTRQGVLHDERNLGVIYTTIDLPDAAAATSRRAVISNARDRIVVALREAAAAVGSGAAPASSEAQRMLTLWGPDASRQRLLEAADLVRFQLGQADRFREGLERSGRWESHIARTFAELGLPPELAALPHVESSFTPTAYSKVGASGLWQFMRSTGRLYMRVDDTVDERLDPFRSTEAAAQLLANNYRALGTWPLAITAYNHGTAGMRRARDTMGTDDFAVIARRYDGRAFGFASRNFYPSFLAALTIDQNPERYFGKIERAAPLRFYEIQLPTPVAIDQIERRIGLSRVLVRELNPALRPAVWSGARKVPRGYRLRVPAEAMAAANEFAKTLGTEVVEEEPRVAARYAASVAASEAKALAKAALASASAAAPSAAAPSAAATPTAAVADAVAATKDYRVRRGDTLSSLARRFGLSVLELARLNDLDPKTKLRHGHTLRVPAS
jgi:membrane-bound lytic murein transglycosylase D